MKDQDEKKKIDLRLWLPDPLAFFRKILGALS